MRALMKANGYSVSIGERIHVRLSFRQGEEAVA